MNTSSTTQAQREPEDANRAWVGLALLLLPTAMVAIDINILFLALPAITTDLNATALDQLWIADIYTLFVGALVIVAGALGDRIGRRRLLIWGCTGFLLASLLAAFAPTSETLIAARGLQGIAGATLMPSTLALIGQLFDEQRRTKAIALWATCQFGCAALGPVVGGALLNYFWWGAVFLIAVVPCLAVILLGGRLLPEHRDADNAPQVDSRSVVLLVGAMAPLLFLCKSMVPTVDIEATTQVGLLIATLGFSVWFIRRQGSLESPLLDLGLLLRPAIATTVAALVLTGICLAGLGFWATQYLQSVLGHSPLVSAALFAPMGLGIAASTMTAPAIGRRITPSQLIPLGLLVSAAGSLFLFTVDDSAWTLILAITLAAVGCGPLFAFGTTWIVSSAPIDRAGRAAGLSETCNYLGSALGIAALGTIGSWLYNHALAPSLNTISPADASNAEEGVAAGRATASQLGDGALLTAVIDAGGAAIHGFGVLVPVLFLLAATGVAWGGHTRSGSTS